MGARPPAEDELVARAAWSRVAEPGDPVAGALLAALGPVDAYAWLRGVAHAGTPSDVPSPSPDGVLGVLEPSTARRLARSVRGWAPRALALEPRRDLDVLHRLGGALVVPGGPGWPAGLDDLGPARPACLWVLGDPDLATLLAGAVAVVGSRATTAYGEHVAGELTAGLTAAGRCVVSGGAYGIDAVAHRVAIGTDGRTVAVLAGGPDRPYPAGNARLLAAVRDAGALVSEVPPGCVPTRSRFLQRNRLIAAAARAVVVVEAAWRSGALSTAAHAAALLRPVGAVPGPVTSAASAGCHRLLRGGAAVCVTDAGEVLELAADAGEHLAALRTVERPEDALDPDVRRLLEALPARAAVPPERLAVSAGMSLGDVRAGLGRLELTGFATEQGGRWRRSTRGAHDGHAGTQGALTRPQGAARPESAARPDVDDGPRRRGPRPDGCPA